MCIDFSIRISESLKKSIVGFKKQTVDSTNISIFSQSFSSKGKYIIYKMEILVERKGNMKIKVERKKERDYLASETFFLSGEVLISSELG